MIDPENYKPRARGDGDESDDDFDGEETERRTRNFIPPEGFETDWDELIDTYSAEGTTFVYLRRQEASDWVFLAKLDTTDASLESIQSRFGGGKYRVQIMDRETRKQKAQRTFRVAGKMKSGDGSDEETPPTPIAPPVHTNGDSVGVGEVLRLAITALTTKPQIDPLMTTLITALVGRGKSGDGVDPLELQKLLQAAEDRGYNRGKELGEAIAGAAGDGDGVARALASNLPAVVDAFKSAQQSYAGSQVRPVQPKPKTIAAPATPTPETPAPTTEGEAMGIGWINALRPAVPVILNWARSGKDATVKAANTIDDLRDDIRDQIAVQAEEPDFVASVIRAIPEFQAPEVQTWVTVFLSTIQEILTTPDDEGILGGEVAEA